MGSLLSMASTRSRNARQSWCAFILVVGVYFLMPNLRLPHFVLESVQLFFAGLGVVYFLSGLAGRNLVLPGDFPRAFFAVSGAIFVFINYTFVSLWLLSPSYLVVDVCIFPKLTGNK